ncbi:MAG: hypothetical protein KatS3mg077_0814 [Candidatus Binatia bacterium]|nr:MAG: hypothetical protein KatS3mg077_0814 [Candidatus Binatia bacterium]
MSIGVRKNLLAVNFLALCAAFSGAPALAQVCPGSCNNDNRVSAAELTRMVAIILRCSGNPAGCPEVAGGCAAGDTDNDGQITVADLLRVIDNILRYDTGCPPPPATFTPTDTATVTQTRTPTVTNTPLPVTETPTNTPPPTHTFTPQPTATDTPVPTATDTSTPTLTLTPTVTNTPAPAVCGNGVVDPGEECDDGGICVGGDNAGTACTSESQCVGNGICIGGEKLGVACATDDDCPGSKCVHCRTFGGDGCAANCTTERTVLGLLGPGTGARLFNETFAASPLALNITGWQRLTFGKPRDGVIPVVIRTQDSNLEKISVSVLACACVRTVAAKTCGGTLFEADGQTLATNCTLDEGICAELGKPPCAFLHGPGNSASGVIGCEGLSPGQLQWKQNAGGVPPPPPPTPPPGSGPPEITLFGEGPPGSAVFLTTTRIGTASGACPVNPVPTPTPGGTPGVFPYGNDGLFCTDDDPEAARGTPNTLPLITGRVEIFVENHYNPVRKRLEFIPATPPASTEGVPFNCAALTADEPSIVGASIVGGFTSLNQPTLGDIAVVNAFVYSTPTLSPTVTMTRTMTPTRTRTPTNTPRR